MAKKNIYICENEYGEKTDNISCEYAEEGKEFVFDVNIVDPLCPNEKCKQPLKKIRTEGGSEGASVKNIVIGAVAIALVGLLGWGGFKLLSGEPGVLRGAPKTINFGEVSPNQLSKRIFTLSNKGKGTLKITKISTNNSDVSIDPVSVEIEPRKKAKITISFTPKKVGTVTSHIILESNDAKHPKIKVTVKGVVRKIDWSKGLDEIMKKSSATHTP